MSREDTETIRAIRRERVKAAEQCLALAAHEYARSAEYLAQCVRDLAALDDEPVRTTYPPAVRHLGNPDRYATCGCDTGDVHRATCPLFG